MGINVAQILGILMALGGTVVAFLFIVPEKKRAALPKILQLVHDLFNFKYLVLEIILKALYIFATLYCIMFGFFLLFSGYTYGSGYGYYAVTYFKSYALEGLAIMFLGPIAVRITFEISMMFVLLVKNVIQINSKLSKDSNDNGVKFGIDIPKKEEASEPVVEAPVAPVQPVAPVAPVAPVQPEPNFLFCTQCGTRYDANVGGCPNCGKN